MIRLADQLAESTRGSLNVKQVQRAWDTFRKRLREHYPCRVEKEESNLEPDFIPQLRHQINQTCTLQKVIQHKLGKRVAFYD